MTRARRTALLVMGMHRSGTSALTGVIGLMGADLPNDLMAASDLNAKGFFESNRITGFDEELLASAGFTWWDCRRFPAEWFSSPVARAFARRAADELAAEYGDSALFVLKDPRICRLAPFWLPVLRDNGCKPLVILPLRHPRDVAASLEHRAGYDPDYGLLMWLRHVLDAEAETRGTRRVFTSYEALMTDWSAEIRRIGEGLGLSWPRSLSVARPGIDAFLSGDLQHFARTGAERAATSALPPLVRKTYEILSSWARDGERPSDHGRLDKLRGKLDAATDSFGGLARRGEEWRNEARQFRTAHHELAGTYTRQTAELEAARAQIAVLDPEVGRLKAETLALQAEVAVQKRERAEEFGQLHARLAEAGQRLTEIDRLRAEAVAAATEARTTLTAEARAEADAARAAFAAQAEATAEERRRLQAELAAAALRLDDMAAELAAAEFRAARLGEVEAELHQARSALIQREEETDQLRRRLEALEARSARLQTDLDAARAAQADTEHERDRLARRLSRLTAQATATMERDLTLRLATIEARARTETEDRSLAANRDEGARIDADRLHDPARLEVEPLLAVGLDEGKGTEPEASGLSSTEVVNHLPFAQADETTRSGTDDPDNPAGTYFDFPAGNESAFLPGSPSLEPDVNADIPTDSGTILGRPEGADIEVAVTADGGTGSLPGVATIANFSVLSALPPTYPAGSVAPTLTEAIPYAEPVHSPRGFGARKKPRRPHDGVKPPFRGLKRLWRKAKRRLGRRV